MTSNNLMAIASAVLTIIATLISAYVVPYIKQKTTAEDTETIKYYIELAVRCADQIFTPDQREEKKKYVKDYIIRVVDEKLHIKLTDEDIETLIEGFVRQIHYGDAK